MNVRLDVPQLFILWRVLMSILTTLLPIPDAHFLCFFAVLQTILICVSVYVCVCGPDSNAACSIAERVGHTSSSLCDCSPLTPLIGNFGMFGLEAQSRPPGLRREQSGRPVHKSDRCTRCHYPPLIIILPVIVPLSASLAVHPA